jgi:1-deoxy-D-xylulose-5-phosphate synthase
VGFKPVVAIYSTFLQRAYDQIIEDVALQDLPVVFCLDRAGIVGEDGVTHQGIFDIVYLRSIPNLVIMAPKDTQELEEMLGFSFKLDKPVALRYPKGIGTPLNLKNSPLELGKVEILKEGSDFVVFALGSMVISAYEALNLLAKEGLSGTLVNARFVKPLDSQLLKKICFGSKHIFTVEEGIIDAGFGSAISEAVGMPVTRLGLPCEFIVHGKREIILDKYGLTAEKIATTIKSAYA